MGKNKQKKFHKKICVCMAFMLTFITLFSIVELNQTEKTVWGAEAVRISKTSMTMEKGESKTLIVTGTKRKVKWTSSDKSVATVSSNGKVKAKKEGEAIILAEVGEKSCQCKITVKKASQNTARLGFYVGGSDNSRRVAVQNISGNQVTFVVFYSAMRESLSDPIVGTLEDGKVKFTYKSDWGNSGNGTIIFHDKYIELKTDGNDFLSTNNKTIKLKWINKNTDIMQIY